MLKLPLSQKLNLCVKVLLRNVLLMLDTQEFLEILLLLSLMLIGEADLERWLAEGLYGRSDWNIHHALIFFITIAAIYGLVLLIHAYNLIKHPNTIFSISKITFLTYICALAAGITKVIGVTGQSMKLEFIAYFLTIGSFVILAVSKLFARHKYLKTDPRIYPS